MATMPMSELVAQAASAQCIGARSRQEDAIVTHAPDAEGPFLAVLSDGMGGHDDGDLASRIIASEMFREVYVACSRRATMEKHGPSVFRAALNGANLQLKHQIESGRLKADTGGTLVCLTILGDRLRWVSVGDSPLYLFRQNQLKKLNETHSLAAQLDFMVSNRQIDAETARTHPDRNCLISAVTGHSIKMIDCPDAAQDLAPGDIVLLASDGLNVLSDAEIASILRQNKCKDPSAITRALLQAIRKHASPNQDNTSLVAIRIERAADRSAAAMARFRQWFHRGKQSLRGLSPVAGQSA